MHLMSTLLQKPYKWLYIICLFYVSLNLCAQVGSIEGYITESKTGERLMFADVCLQIQETLTGTQSDLDGFYKIDSISVGTHTIIASWIGLEYQKESVQILANETIVLNFALREENYFICELPVNIYIPPLLDPENISTGATYRQSDIRRQIR